MIIFLSEKENKNMTKCCDQCRRINSIMRIAEGEDVYKCVDEDCQCHKSLAKVEGKV